VVQHVDFDGIHMALITGFVSFVSAVASHVITKHKLSGRFVPSEVFFSALSSNADKMMQHCNLMRAQCPVAALKFDIRQIKEVQLKRTEELRDRYARDDEIWRIVLTELRVPIEDQNRLLGRINNHK
jgi:hypothetical protein